MDEFGKTITVGSQVLARWKRAPKYYAAKVISVNAELNTCHLVYLDGDHDEAVPGANIRMPRSLTDYFDDLILVKRKAFDELPLMDNPEKFYSLEEFIDHASPKALEAMLHWLNTIPDCAYPLHIEEFNYTYDSDQRIINASTKQKFHWVGQAHYDTLGDVILGYIHDQLKDKYGLVEVLLPKDDALGSSVPLHRTQQINIFHSPNILTAKKVVWLIQGSGPIRPGQWARALCINDSLDYGAMFKFVEAAQQRDYAVIILNPNGGIVEASAKEEYDNYRALRSKYFAEQLAKDAKNIASQSHPEDDSEAKEEQKCRRQTSTGLAFEPALSYYREKHLQVPYKIENSSKVIDADKLKQILLEAVGPNMSQGKRYFIFDQAKDAKMNAVILDSRPHRHTKTLVQGATPSSLAAKIAIPGHSDRETHTCTVYEEIISKCTEVQEHVIIAQGAGGYSVMALLGKYYQELLPHMRSIVFTDSVHEVDPDCPDAIKSFLKVNSLNWVASLAPLDTPERLYKGMRNSGCAHVSAGTNIHDFTTGSVFESAWRFIDSRSMENPTNSRYEIPEMKKPVPFPKRSTCQQS